MLLWLTLPVDMNEHGITPKMFGALLAINGVLIVFAQPVVTELSRRLEPTRSLALGTLLVGMGYGVGGLGSGAGVYAAAIVVLTVGEMLMMPVGPTVVSRLAPASLRAGYQGAYQMAWSMSACMAPLIGSRVMGRFGGQALWFGCLGLAIVAAMGHLAIGPARRRRLRQVTVKEGASGS